MPSASAQRIAYGSQSALWIEPPVRHAAAHAAPTTIAVGATRTSVTRWRNGLPLSIVQVSAADGPD
jgi:hypothetical protein